MAREKTITLYSRNGIRITKTTNIDTKKLGNTTYLFEELSRKEVLEKIQTKVCKKPHYEDVKCESKLGFYYHKQVYVVESNTEKDSTKCVYFKKYIVWLDGEKWELEYPYTFTSALMDVTINKYDNRPWDIIPGYKGIPDHFITALHREIMKFIDMLYTHKNLINFNAGVDSIKRNILLDLFGDERGPQEQPNNIKIVSHGFDLKESFRKRKEN